LHAENCTTPHPRARYEAAKLADRKGHAEDVED
jgi:hypothetical protein